MLPSNQSNVQKKSRLHYSGKKKYFTQKVQILVDSETEEILSSDFCQGRTHDFRLFKESGINCRLMSLFLQMQAIRVLQKFTKIAEFPLKGKKCPLSQEEKKKNKDLAKQWIFIEHIFRKLKIFRILSEKYRNRRKRFALRFNLIAACCYLALRLLEEIWAVSSYIRR